MKPNTKVTVRKADWLDLLFACESAADWLCDSHPGSDQHERGNALRKTMSIAKQSSGEESTTEWLSQALNEGDGVYRP